MEDPVDKKLVSAYPEPYVRKKRKRGRPKKIGRPIKDKYEKIRASPSKREGSRFRSIILTEECYYMLKELSSFYNCTPGFYVFSLVLPAFDYALEESVTLQRIEENRKKANNETQQNPDAPNTIDTPRRTHF